ncbi:MAG: hypothetical protein HYZ53_20405 [Planctomycetes bacterium]|nr:hypothetical protein [Planctomycetota bacterium]
MSSLRCPMCAKAIPRPESAKVEVAVCPFCAARVPRNAWPQLEVAAAVLDEFMAGEVTIAESPIIVKVLLEQASRAGAGTAPTAKDAAPGGRPGGAQPPNPRGTPAFDARRAPGPLAPPAVLPLGPIGGHEPPPPPPPPQWDRVPEKRTPSSSSRSPSSGRSGVRASGKSRPDSRSGAPRPASTPAPTPTATSTPSSSRTSAPGSRASTRSGTRSGVPVRRGRRPFPTALLVAILSSALVLILLGLVVLLGRLHG